MDVSIHGRRTLFHFFKVQSGKITVCGQFQYCPKQPDLPRHKKVKGLFELFGALYMYISAKMFKDAPLSAFSLLSLE